MNKGHNYYYKKSSNIFSFVFKKQRFIDKLTLIMYVIASTIGKLIFFIRPIFLISDQNIANMMINGHSFSILKAFHGTKERYGKIFCADLAIFMIYVAVLVGIAIVLFLPTIGLINKMFNVALIIWIIAVGLYVVILIISSLQFVFVPFVGSKNQELDFSDYLFNSRIAARKNIKTVIANEVISFILGDFLTLLGLFLVVFLPFYNGEVVSLILSLLLGPAFAVLYIFVCAPAKVRREIYIYLLGSDACRTNHAVVVKRVASSTVEFEPIFDTPVGKDAVDLNK